MSFAIASKFEIFTGYITAYPISIQVMTASYLPNISFDSVYWQNYYLNIDKRGLLEICASSDVSMASLTASSIFFYNDMMGYLNSTHAVILSNSYPMSEPVSVSPFSANYEMPPTTASLISK